LNVIEDVPGVYYFARHHGKNREPFYIGESLKLRLRLRTHLQTKRIADVLRGISGADVPEILGGHRYFHFAYFKPRGRQDPKTCIRIAQKFMIRESVRQSIPLINSQLSPVKTHNIVFDGQASVFAGKNIVAD
jgi:hypothetical protein